tara:strand:+ start:51 stop:686 length:636 start_codon:yes stop_codon:yes gene_type:complete
MENLLKCWAVFLFLLFFGCETNVDTELRYSCLGDCTENLDGEFSTLEDCESICDPKPNNIGLMVTVFLYENCPIAQYMCGPLRNTYRYFCDTLGHNMVFRGFSPNSLSTEASLSNFVVKYDIPFAVTSDYSEENNEPGLYTQSYLPIVTPEVFVELNGELIYRGMIDNSYEALGDWSSPTEHYLVEVLTNVVNNQEIVYFETTAIGCFINY